MQKGKRHTSGGDYTNLWAEEGTDMYKAKIAGEGHGLFCTKHIQNLWHRTDRIPSQKTDMKLPGIPSSGQPGFLSSYNKVYCYKLS